MFKPHFHFKQNNFPCYHPPERILSSLIGKERSCHQGVYLVAIGGPGGTGKSTFSGVLKQLLGNSTSILILDDYKTSREFRRGRKIFGPHPEANNMSLIQEHLELLKKGCDILKPVYDRGLGKSVEKVYFSPKEVVLVEGEVATYEAFLPWIDLSIYIDSEWKTQLNTRVFRDILARNYSKEKAVETFLESNLREFSQFGLKSKSWADVHLFCHEDYHLEVEALSVELFQTYEDLFSQELDRIPFYGDVVPLMTPFTKDQKVDYEGFIKHIEWLGEKGVKRVWMNSIFSEEFLLHSDEKLKLFKLARQYFPGLIVYSLNMSSLVEMKKQVDWLVDWGCDGILFSISPFFFSDSFSLKIFVKTLGIEALREFPFLFMDNDFFMEKSERATKFLRQLRLSKEGAESRAELIDASLFIKGLCFSSNFGESRSYEDEDYDFSSMDKLYNWLCFCKKKVHEKVKFYPQYCRLS